MSYVLPLLADLPSPESPESVGWIVLTVAGIAGGLYYVLMCWQLMFPKKSPPDHDVWATKVELAKLEKDHKAEMERIEERFEEWLTQQAKQHDEQMKLWAEWRDKMGEWQRSVERAIGHVETKAEAATKDADKAMELAQKKTGR